MEIHNLSLHASKNFNMDMKVYIALDAPNFASREEFAKWRSRVTEYVNVRRESLDMRNTDKNYSVVYVPEVVTDDEHHEIEPDFSNADDNVLFITKRPDTMDGEQSFAKDIEVPGNHTIIVMHDLGNIIPSHEDTPPELDVVSASLRIFGWTIALFAGAIAAVHVIRTNPYSMLGL